MQIFPGFRKMKQPYSEIEIIKETQIIEKPKTVGEFFYLYKIHLIELKKTADILNITSVLTRRLSPAWGGPTPKGTRSSQKEIETALAFFESIPLEKLADASSSLEEYFEINKVGNTIRWLSRSQLKKMLNWGTKNEYLKQPEHQIFYRFKEVTKSRNYPQNIKLIENRPSWGERNLLGFFDSDYVVGEAADNSKRIFSNWNNWTPHILEYPNLFSVLYALDIFQSKLYLFLGNKELEVQIFDWIDFLINRLHHRLPTAERDFLAILRFLGWLHRQKNIPLENLRFQIIIPFIKLKLKREDYKNSNGIVDRAKFNLAKMTAVEDMEEAVEDMLTIFDEYLSGRQISPDSKINYMKSFINLAKFLYKDETKEFKVQRGFRDVPLIESLRRKANEFEHERSSGAKNVIPKQKRMIPWLDVLEVVEKLRVEATLTERISVRHTRVNSKGQKPVERIKRTDRAIACDFQQFLIMAVYTAMPPGRPREYYELKLNKSIVEGILEQGIFTPKNQMKNPDLASWWIHLMPQDYKTGKIYQEWWGKLPNTQFSNGKTLYWYIEEWLTKWRPFFNPNHDYLFTTEKGKPIRGSAFAGRIERCICRFTGVRVNPHSLRHIFVTYLKDIGATEEQLNSAAKAMRHSRQTQSSIYDLQDLQSALEPSFELAQTIAESFYERYKK
ncbi:hypothetical protein [Nostoc sp. CCY0012]|uniref:hypothetical protein n=1 Tax=Nostoc sp. CCY0012 TaxID=1056123 RepID=UPI0039C6EE66